MAKKKNRKNKSKNLTKIVLTILGAVILFFLVIFILSGIVIGKSVKEQCNFAKEKYEGNCVSSLINLLEDEENSFREKNSAIWALGQIGDEKTLPVLKKYYTGQIPVKEPLDKSLSQYELKKAINLLSGGVNLTAIIWKHDGIMK